MQRSDDRPHQTCRHYSTRSQHLCVAQSPHIHFLVEQKSHIAASGPGCSANHGAPASRCCAVEQVVRVTLSFITCRHSFWVGEGAAWGFSLEMQRKAPCGTKELRAVRCLQPVIVTSGSSLQRSGEQHQSTGEPPQLWEVPPNRRLIRSALLLTFSFQFRDERGRSVSLRSWFEVMHRDCPPKYQTSQCEKMPAAFVLLLSCKQRHGQTGHLAHNKKRAR